jgi:hypothetical protein
MILKDGKGFSVIMGPRSSKYEKLKVIIQKLKMVMKSIPNGNLNDSSMILLVLANRQKKDSCFLMLILTGYNDRTEQTILLFDIW